MITKNIHFSVTSKSISQIYYIVFFTIVIMIGMLFLCRVVQGPDFSLKYAVSRGNAVIAIESIHDPKNRLTFYSPSPYKDAEDNSHIEAAKAVYGAIKVDTAPINSYKSTTLSELEWETIEDWHRVMCGQLPEMKEVDKNAPYMAVFKCDRSAVMPVIHLRLEDIPDNVMTIIRSGSRPVFISNP